MARLHYYQFPENMDAHARFKVGASNINGYCPMYPERESCGGCPNNPDNIRRAWAECEGWLCTESETELSGISITYAKQLLKEYGGHAYTRHIDRDGGCFEITPIELKKNNSRHKYNRHL